MLLCIAAVLIGLICALVIALMRNAPGTRSDESYRFCSFITLNVDNCGGYGDDDDDDFFGADTTPAPPAQLKLALEASLPAAPEIVPAKEGFETKIAPALIAAINLAGERAALKARMPRFKGLFNKDK